MSTDGQGTKCRKNIADNFNRLSTAHERYRRQTGGRAIAYSERERAKNHTCKLHEIVCTCIIVAAAWSSSDDDTLCTSGFVDDVMFS